MILEKWITIHLPASEGKVHIRRSLFQACSIEKQRKALCITTAYLSLHYNCCCPAFPYRININHMSWSSSNNSVACWDVFLVLAVATPWLQACDPCLAFPSTPSCQATVDLLQQTGHLARGPEESDCLCLCISIDNLLYTLQGALFIYLFSGEKKKRKKRKKKKKSSVFDRERWFLNSINVEERMRE